MISASAKTGADYRHLRSCTLIIQRMLSDSRAATQQLHGLTELPARLFWRLFYFRYC